MDFTSEAPNERLFRNPVLQRSLSLQASIFYEGEDRPMTLAAKLAWIFLHLRIASLGFGTTINTLQRGEELKIGMLLVFSLFLSFFSFLDFEDDC